MSEFLGSPGNYQGGASIGLNGSVMTSQLMNLLIVDSIQPGDAPSYEVCKTIYSYHPLGAKLADASIKLAQSQVREIDVPALGATRLVEAFVKEWGSIGRVGADNIILNAKRISRIYGVSALIVGARGFDTNKPLPPERLHKLDLYFNVLDPLNAAGSLVLNQDPNAPDYQKPTVVASGGHQYHPSRTVVTLNEEPIYIEWTNSAFGYVGRSVYQRCLFPLKTFVQSMLTDDMVTRKAALLVAKMKAPGNFIDNVMLAFAGAKAQSLKSGVTGNVLTVGHDDSIETLNMQNLADAAKFARDNCLKNIASGADMPALLVNLETLADGFGEGAEDAKQIARHVDRIRAEMVPLYDFMDGIVQRRAWTPEFYETLKPDYPEYRKMPYETAFMQWRNKFKAIWPNLLVEPDSEKIKVDKTRFESVVAMAEIVLPVLDPENRARMVMWMQENANAHRNLFPAPLDIDEDALARYTPPTPPEAPRQPLAFESET